MKELNPCPVCGGKPLLEHFCGDMYLVVCENCRAHTYVVHQPANAISEWMTRHITISPYTR